VNITAVRVDDIVQCDIKGRIFYAVVETVDADLGIKPLERGVTWRHVTPRQVIGHWRKAGRMRPNRKVAP
jgi:hypothetical protein